MRSPFKSRRSEGSRGTLTELRRPTDLRKIFCEDGEAIETCKDEVMLKLVCYRGLGLENRGLREMVEIGVHKCYGTAGIRPPTGK